MKNFINTNNIDIIGRIVNSQSLEPITQLTHEKGCDFVGKLEELITNEKKVSKRIIGSLNANIERYSHIDERLNKLSNKTKRKINFTGVINTVRDCTMNTKKNI